MSLILKGIDMPPTVNGVKLTHELYIRSDGRVFDDEFEEVGQAIQIDRPHCNDCKYNESDYCTIWFSGIVEDGYCYKGEKA